MFKIRYNHPLDVLYLFSMALFLLVVVLKQTLYV